MNTDTRACGPYSTTGTLQRASEALEAITGALEQQGVRALGPYSPARVETMTTAQARALLCDAGGSHHGKQAL